MQDIRKGSCPLCAHHQIVECTPVDHLYGKVALHVGAATAYGPSGDPTGTYSPFLAYVCRSCGYTQWFATNPAGIPIGKEQRTRLIEGASPSGPFR
jgi:hypothetical protein